MKKYLLSVCMMLVWGGISQLSAQTAITPKIQVALLLDTSSSMDGLIEQAKSQLWGIVKDLSKARYGDKPLKIEIALIEYGNDGLSADAGYMQVILPLSADLDKLSEELFKLDTYGGLEYCGTAIQFASQQLSWSDDQSDIKLLYIAGNEAFNQGNINYLDAIKFAYQKGIQVNTIHCGSPEQGITDFWKDGAEIGGGEFANLQHNNTTVYIATPYDDTLAMYNDSLNSTYIAYGSAGRERKQKQLEQDKNADSYGSSNMADRVSSKASPVYYNGAWDLVDASKEENFKWEDVDEAYLADTLKNMNTEQRQEFTAAQSQKRSRIQEQISLLSQKRDNFIRESKPEEEGADQLSEMLLDGVREAAELKGYTFE